MNWKTEVRIFISLNTQQMTNENQKPTPVSSPGKSHGQRSLVGSSPWGRTESGTTERLTRTYLIRTCCVAQGTLLGML